MDDDLKTDVAESSRSPRCYVRLRELPKLPSHQFRYDNSIGYQRIPPPAFWDTANGVILVDKGFALVGWCDRLPPKLLRKSHEDANQIGLMMFCERYGEVWEHYPWYEQEDLDEFRFQCSRPPV